MCHYTSSLSIFTSFRSFSPLLILYSPSRTTMYKIMPTKSHRRLMPYVVCMLYAFHLKDKVGQYLSRFHDPSQKDDVLTCRRHFLSTSDFQSFTLQISSDCLPHTPGSLSSIFSTTTPVPLCRASTPTLSFFHTINPAA